MLSSRNNEEKFEARFLTRLDVLSERVDTLAATVATTSSGLAKKDGEIAALGRAIEARDQTLLTLVEHVNRLAQAPAADAPVEASELRSLRNAVAALTKERASGVNAAHIEQLVTTVRAVTERVNALTAAAAAPPVPVPDPAMTARVDSVEAELALVRAALEHPPEELVATISALRDQVDGLAVLEPGVTEEQLERRIAATSNALATAHQRLDALAEAVADPTPDPAVTARVDAVEAELALVRAALEHPPEELVATISALRAQVDDLAALEPGVTEEQLERRLTATSDALAALHERLGALTDSVEDRDRTRADDERRLEQRLGKRDEAFAELATRLDVLAETVEAAASSLGDKEHELASLQLHFTESSTRIESIVDDIREALHAFPELSATSIDELAARLDRLETTARKTNETGTRTAGELSGRIDVIDERLATVADEVSRAKTLWPVALRSLEARLEDVAPARKPEASPAPAESGSAEVPDDLLAGLRDSLQAMESVAAEMARASETLTDLGPVDDADREAAPFEHAPPDQAPLSESEPEPVGPLDEPRAAAGSATIVPLRAGDP